MADANVDGAEKSALLLTGEHVLAVPHILIVQDQPAIQELLRWTLQLAGYHTTLCAGRQATLTWREQATPPGDDPVLLLLDVSPLCVSEAADFLCHLRTQWLDAGGVPPQIIALTTSTRVQAELGSTECVLLKPFHVRDLLALIQRRVATPSRGNSTREENLSGVSVNGTS